MKSPYLLPLLLAACASGAPSAPTTKPISVDPPPVPSLASPNPPQPIASPDDAGAETAAFSEPQRIPAWLQRDGGCGCSPCSPIKSTDSCSSAADCAPAAVCHARACVARAKAPQRPPGLSCTMSLECNTIDVGKCDCVDGVCALVGR